MRFLLPIVCASLAAGLSAIATPSDVARASVPGHSIIEALSVSRAAPPYVASAEPGAEVAALADETRILCLPVTRESGSVCVSCASGAGIGSAHRNCGTPPGDGARVPPHGVLRI